MYTDKEQVLFSFLSKHMDLTVEEKDALLELDIFKAYPKGYLLFREGDFTKTYYLVLKGCIRTYYITDGQENTMEFYIELDSYSPPSTINETASKLYASCLEDSLLVVSTPEMEEMIFARFPRFETLCRIFAEKSMASTQLSFEQFRNRDPEQRYLTLLKTKPYLIQRVPQYHLASYLGVRPESLSRIRKRLAERQKHS
jgi:CRP-like cAMP-binding protein